MAFVGFEVCCCQFEVVAEGSERTEELETNEFAHFGSSSRESQGCIQGLLLMHT